MKIVQEISIAISDSIQYADFIILSFDALSIKVADQIRRSIYEIHT